MSFKETYRGTDIQMTEAGLFRAVINGKAMSFASLISIKKKIDAAQAFEPFKVVIFAGVGRSYSLAQDIITGFVPGKRQRYAGDGSHWVAKDGRALHTVYRAEDKLALQAYCDAIKRQEAERQALKEKHDKESDQLRKLLVPVPFPSK